MLGISKTRVFASVLGLLSLMLSSCEDDHKYGSEGDDMKMTITALTQMSGVESRAVFGDDDEVDITDYTFLYYDGNSADSKLLRVHDIPAGNLPYSTILPSPGVGKTFIAIMIANATSADLGDAAVLGASLSDLQNATFDITRTFNKPTDAKAFTWSGFVNVTSASAAINFMLNPNVAKINVTITNASAESQIHSVRLKNVATTVGYACNALNKAGVLTSTQSASSFVKYDIETFDQPLENGGTYSDSWYVPQNMQGEGDRTSNAPANATYVEIDGVRNADRLSASYKVYPGKNPDKKEYVSLTNFDVEADYIYNLNVTITDDGLNGTVSTGFEADNYLATAKIKLPENSNCYMIHPLGDRIDNASADMTTVYELPIDRVNDYWATVVGETGTGDAEHALTADSRWRVEVIWQDIAGKRAIRFCDEYGNSIEQTDASGVIYAPGEGLNPFCFKLENTATTPDAQTYGNVLVGLKKIKSDGTVLDGYAWSWHLWITDYNPDAAPAYDGSNKIWQSGGNIDLQGQYYAADVDFTNPTSVTPVYNFKANDGNVQHYHSLYDWYWETHTQSSSVWDGGIYDKKWIMDRNIGSLCSEVALIEHPLDSWGMYYQYGRKDPFSYKVVYDITGQKTIYSGGTEPHHTNPQWKRVDTPADDLDDGVMFPCNYYYNSSDDSWVNNQPSTNWYSPDDDPMNPDHAKCQKTLFDPCPPGWCVPSQNAFYFGHWSYVINGSVPASTVEEACPSGHGYTIPTKNSNGTTTYHNSTDYGFAKPYAEDLEAGNFTSDKYAHTSVTIHADVYGTYSHSDYVGYLDTGTLSSDKSKTSYNQKITSYRDRYRMFATLYSTSTYNSFKVLRARFPLQGNISGNTGYLTKVDVFDGTALSYYVSGVRWPNYNCYTQQACLWTLENRGSLEYQATLVNFVPSTSNNCIDARQEKRRGRLFLRFHGTMNVNSYIESRGQNVRCIQEPD